PVPQGLNAAGGCTGANSDQESAPPTHIPDLLKLLWRTDRTFHERQGKFSLQRFSRCLQEIGDLHGAGHVQQLILAIEETELAAVARGELEHTQPWSWSQGGAHASRTSQNGRITSTRKTGPSTQIKLGPNWQWPHCPTAHCMFRSRETYRRSWGT